MTAAKWPRPQPWAVRRFDPPVAPTEPEGADPLCWAVYGLPVRIDAGEGWEQPEIAIFASELDAKAFATMKRLAAARRRRASDAH